MESQAYNMREDMTIFLVSATGVDFLVEVQHFLHYANVVKKIWYMKVSELKNFFLKNKFFLLVC